MKTLFLTICLAIIALSAGAQDKIYKRDGAEIDAKVKTVGDQTVIYKRFDNQDGPEYTILKNEVAKIVYQNGTTDVFENFDKESRHDKMSGKEGKHTTKYGNNIFSITPLAYTVSLDGSINDVGIGLCYERLLDQRGHIGFNLPVMVSFSSNKDFNNYAYYNNGLTASYGNYTSFYFMPGIKFYPASSREKVRYSLGASLFCIFGSEPYIVYNNTGNTAPYGNFNYAMYGFMISNSVNIAATKHLYMAIDLGAGIPFADNRHAENEENDGLGLLLDPFIQIGFKIGYRY